LSSIEDQNAAPARGRNGFHDSGIEPKTAEKASRNGKSAMSLIIVLLMSSLVVVLAVMGLADAVAHLVGWGIRSIKSASLARSSIALPQDRLTA
jgi:hypothetical protein